jgi:hypothetical protein
MRIWHNNAFYRSIQYTDSSRIDILSSIIELLGKSLLHLQLRFSLSSAHVSSPMTYLSGFDTTDKEVLPSRYLSAQSDAEAYQGDQHLPLRSMAWSWLRTLLHQLHIGYRFQPNSQPHPVLSHKQKLTQTSQGQHLSLVSHLHPLWISRTHSDLPVSAIS